MVSGEVEEVEEMAMVTSTNTRREAKIIDLVVVSKTSPEVQMVMNFRPIWEVF